MEAQEIGRNLPLHAKDAMNLWVQFSSVEHLGTPFTSLFPMAYSHERVQEPVTAAFTGVCRTVYYETKLPKRTVYDNGQNYEDGRELEMAIAV